MADKKKELKAEELDEAAGGKFIKDTETSSSLRVTKSGKSVKKALSDNKSLVKGTKEIKDKDLYDVSGGLILESRNLTIQNQTVKSEKKARKDNVKGVRKSGKKIEIV